MFILGHVDYLHPGKIYRNLKFTVWNFFQIMKYYIMKIFSVICILASQFQC